ncbi:MAG: ferritin-like domain-containing protein [Chloroflexi bacterium]|nr:ferritin-like domain-containing protein [Chloroflexota bacterium]
MPKDIIGLLNKDLEGEHGAIIQYLNHAYAMGEGEVACEIEAIAREEMRHLDWLAEIIVELGGTPSFRRGKMRKPGKLIPGWMKDNVLAEEDAIAMYKQHIEAISNPKIKRLLRRILSDEVAHRGKFAHLVDKVKREDMKDLRGDKKDKVADTLNWGIEHEYTVIIQYLLHSYMAGNEDTKNEMQDQAINEMQHMGWLAEEMVSGKGSPRLEHSQVFKSSNMANNLKADIEIEKEVATEYGRAARELKDTGLKELLLRIKGHEDYHAALFGDLLKEETKAKSKQESKAKPKKETKAKSKKETKAKSKKETKAKKKK